MFKKLFYLSALILFSTLCSAEGFHSSSLLLSEQTTTGRYDIKIYTRNPIDTSILVKDLTVTDSDATIKSKINSQRELAYPNEEIVVEVTPVESTIKRQSNDYIGLVAQIYAWNTYTSYNTIWHASYHCNVATGFIQVLQGSYHLAGYANGAWRRIASNINGTAAGWTSGNYQLLGVKGKGLSTGGNRAHVVLFFFK
jgi:hypothetical protein